MWYKEGGMMMKNKMLGYSALGVLFVVLSVIAFIIPTAKTGAFWIAYVFTFAAFAAQIGIWKMVFGKEDTLKSKFFAIPVVSVGIIYLVVQIIAFALFAAVPTLPVWSAVVGCAVILGVSAVGVIGAEAGRDEIERVEEKVQKKVFFIKNLQVEVELLADAENDGEIKTALQKLAETIRFSDPMSSETLAGIESEITEKIAELKTANNKLALIRELNSLVAERNKKCKILE